MLSVRSVDRIVRARVGDDLGDHVAGFGIDDMPVRSLERRNVERLAVWRHRQPVGASVVFLVPEHPIGREVDRRDALDRGHEQAAGLLAGDHAFDVFRLLSGHLGKRRDPSDERVTVVHVVDDHADAAVLDVVADSRFRDVKEMPLAVGSRGKRARENDRGGRDRNEECTPEH